MTLSGFVFTDPDGRFVCVDLTENSDDGLPDGSFGVEVEISAENHETTVFAYDSVAECLADTDNIPEGVLTALGNLLADGYI